MYQYLEDVESDMSAFHRIDDVRDMPARRFISLALRLAAYRGVVRARLQEEQERTPTAQHGAPSSAGTASSAPRVVESDAATLATDPGLGGMFETRREAP